MANSATDADATATYAIPVVPTQVLSRIANPRLAPKVPSGVADILKARFPLSIGFEDLGDGWRVLNYEDEVYFSRGETQFLNSVEYVVTYKRVYANPADLAPREYALYVSRSLHPSQKGDRFQISLLPATQVQTLFTNGETGVRSFSPDDFKPIGQLPTSDAFEQNLSVIYLRKLGEAVTAYGRANLSVLPPLDSAYAARQNLDDFAENDAIFTQPGTTRPFAWNSLFSGRKRAHLAGKSSWILAYEAAPASDGSRAILTLGGRASRLSDKQWRKIAHVSKLD